MESIVKQLCSLVLPDKINLATIGDMLDVCAQTQIQHLSKVQKQVVKRVPFSHTLLKVVKHLQKQTVFVTGVVKVIPQTPTHVDASSVLQTKIFTLTLTTLAQRTGTIERLSALKFLSKVQRQDVNLVIINQPLLTNVMQSPETAMFVIGVVKVIPLAPTHADVFSELQIRMFTSTPTRLALQTGVTGEPFVYETKLLNVTESREFKDVRFFDIPFDHGIMILAEC